ncbi:hypothetical protein B0H13DRAFT_2300289 [Mycena leptocephala]|nr:hypothetical protein B0H13DRAFT_2300289 [Mycena leptocephala]
MKALLASISLGFPDTFDQLWQEKWRVGRNLEIVSRALPATVAAAEKKLRILPPPIRQQAKEPGRRKSPPRVRDADTDTGKEKDKARVMSDCIAIKHQLGKGHNAVVYLIEYNTDLTPRPISRAANKRMENMNRLYPNNPGRAGVGAAPLPRTASPTPLVDRRATEEAQIRREIAIMKKGDHPNIVKFFSFLDEQMSASVSVPPFLPCFLLWSFRPSFLFRLAMSVRRVGYMLDKPSPSTVNDYMEGGELQRQAQAPGGGPYLTTRRAAARAVSSRSTLPTPRRLPWPRLPTAAAKKEEAEAEESDKDEGFD